MTISQRRRADVAFGCYLLIAVWLAVELILEVIELATTSQAGNPALQGAGMLVLLPLAIASLFAALVGFFMTLSLVNWWANAQGLILLPALLLVFFIVLVT